MSESEPYTADKMAGRTKALALRILKLAGSLPRSVTGKTLGQQIARSGTSLAANYRAAVRGRRKAEFIAKLSIAHEKADKTLFWLEMIVESNLIPYKKLEQLMDEANQIIAIIVTSLKTAKRNQTTNS